MSATSFENGDVVRLKSGGPKMTVINNKTEQGNVFVVYWNENENKFNNLSFSPAVLNKLSTNPREKKSLSELGEELNG